MTLARVARSLSAQRGGSLDRLARLLARLLLAVPLVVSCTPALMSPAPVPSSADPGTVPPRPLTLPAAGGTCPVTPGHKISDTTGPGLGSGPVYPVGFGTTGVQQLGSQDGDLFRIKVLWVADPTYAGPIRVRGARIDGTGRLEFSMDAGAPSGELLLPVGTSGMQRTWPSYTLVSGAGCYAYQVDGRDFSVVDVFEVTAA